MIKNNLGRRIRMLRKSAGYTREQLAEWSDYSVDFIGLVERGINAPSIEGCQKIADCLGVSMSELFDFSDIDAG